MSFDFCGTFTFGAVHDNDVKQGFNDVGHTLEDAAIATGEGIKDAAVAVGEGIEDAAEAVADGVTMAANTSLHAFEDFGNQVVDGIENQVIDPVGHAFQDLGNAVDDAYHEAEECARVGLAAVADGAAVVGGAVVDAATSIGEGIEDAAVQAAQAVKTAAEWIEEVGESAVDSLADELDSLGHTLASALEEIRAACEAFVEELKELAEAFLNFFKDLANLKKALEIKAILDSLVDYGWRQLKRGIDLMLGLAPAVLKEGRDNPKLRGVRAMVVGFQPVLDEALANAETALGPLHGDNQAMQLLHQVLDQAERLFADLEAELLAELRGFGLDTRALKELLAILDPILGMVFGVLGSNPLALDLGDLYDTMTDAMAELGDWLETWVVASARSLAHTLVDTLRGAFQAEVYVPGVSELYSLVTLTMTGKARHLSLQEALTVSVAYFIHVSYRVMAGRNLDPRNSELESWIHSLPDLPEPAAVVHFFEEVMTDTVDDGSIQRLFARDGQPASGAPTLSQLSAVSQFALGIVLSFVELVGLVLTGFELLAITTVGGVLVGVAYTVRGFLRMADILSNRYSDARTGLEITQMGFELSILPRALAVSLASSREVKELSKLAAAVLSLIDLVLSAMEKVVCIALETLKHASGPEPTSDKAFAAGYADASATLLSSVLASGSHIVQIVDDPVVETGEAAAAAPETDGVGAAVTPLATKLTRVFDAFDKVAVGIEVTRVFTSIEISISDAPA